MPGATDATADNGGMGDMSGTAARDSLAENEHHATVENDDASDFTIKSDSHGILSVNKEVVLESSDTFKKCDPVAFTTSGDMVTVTSLRKRRTDEQSTVMGDSGTCAGNEGNSS